MTTQNRTERFVYRLLLLDPPQKTEPESGVTRAERAFGFSLVFSGVRCVLQYAILPFVLPLIGITADVAAVISVPGNAPVM